LKSCQVAVRSRLKVQIPARRNLCRDPFRMHSAIITVLFTAGKSAYSAVSLRGKSVVVSQIKF
jgi:hypothetical protein